MSQFTVNYWSGSVNVIEAMTIEDAAKIAGYSDFWTGENVHGIHVWDIDDNGVRIFEVTNSDGDKVATIRPGGNDPDVEVIMDLIDSNPWDNVTVSIPAPASEEEAAFYSSPKECIPAEINLRPAPEYGDAFLFNTYPIVQAQRAENELACYRAPISTWERELVGADAFPYMVSENAD